MQKRYMNFEDEISSYDIARFTLATSRPGRYAGFDELISQSDLTFKIGHSNTGISTTDQLGNAVGPLGYAVTNQGVIIEESEQVGAPFAVDSNGSNTAVRYDAVVLRHSYASTPGGSEATYYIKKGPINNPIFPTVNDPAKDIIVGMIMMPPGATTLGSDGVTYTPSPAPDSGGEKDAKLNSVNVFAKTQQFRKGTKVGPTFDNNAFGEKLFTLKSDGNTFELEGSIEDLLQGIRFDLSTSVQEGTRITLILNAGIGIANNHALASGSVAAGYRAFIIPQALQDGNGGIISPPATGQQKVVELIMFNSKYLVTYVSNTGGVVSRTVSVDSQDTKPGPLFDKIRPSLNIATTVADDDQRGRILVISLKGAQPTWDNVWKNANLTLDANHQIVSGSVPKWKIDFMGVLHLRDWLVTRIPALNTGAPVPTAILISTLEVALPREVKIPIVIDAPGTQYSRGLSGYMMISTSGQVRAVYAYDGASPLPSSLNGVTLNLSPVSIDLNPNV